jgi:hypothetical protein
LIKIFFILSLKENNTNTYESADEIQQQEFEFKQKVLTEFGRYGGVKLWCIENTSLFQEEEPHTLIICNSDLFY